VDIIRGRLTPRRFEHSLAVARQAEYLAKKYGCDPDKARVAGLLHDILKDTDGDSQLQIFKDFAILLDAVEQQAPKLWHARAGAAFLEHILGITDREILDAVRYHTTGRAGMTLLDIVLYLADFTSADRDYPDVDVMRRLTEDDMNEAMRYALAYTIDDLKAQGRPVHPDTLACYRERVGDTNG
jgi:nicotinate-nucleotide adenylyltransferase